MAAIERGSKYPSPDTVERLSVALALRPFYLFVDFSVPTGTDDPILVKFFTQEITDKLVKGVEEAVRPLQNPRS